MIHCCSKRHPLKKALSLIGYYDGVGRVLSVTDPFDQTVSYGYDGQGNRTRLTYPDQKVANYIYDGLNRLQTVTDWQNQVTGYTYDYDEQGRPRSTREVNGITSVQLFDPPRPVDRPDPHGG